VTVGCTLLTVFGVDSPSLNRYIQALAVCNGIAELVSDGSEAEFLHRVNVLTRLKKHWALGHGGTKIVCSSAVCDVDSGDEDSQRSVDVENADLPSVLSCDSEIGSLRVLVLCRKPDVQSDSTPAENMHRPTERYNVIPSLVARPSGI